MWTKVILLSALLLGSKFVAPLPFHDEIDRQRPFQSNWQGNPNIAEQRHGSEFARTHNINTMTNGAQQFSDQNYKINPEPQHFSLPPLPPRINPANPPALSANERRPDSLIPQSNPYPINQNHPIRDDNQFIKQNWHSPNQFAKTAPRAMDNTAFRDIPLLTVPQPYYNSAQKVQSPKAKTDSIYPSLTTKDVHYPPMPPDSKSIKYLDQSESNAGTQTGPVHYKNYIERYAPNTNLLKSESNVHAEDFQPHFRTANSQIFENNDRPNSIKILNSSGSYIAPPDFRSIGNVVPIRTGLNNGHNKYADNPVIPPKSRPPISSRPNGQPTNTYVENSLVNSRPANEVHDTNNAPVVPVDTILYETGTNRYTEKKKLVNDGEIRENDQSQYIHHFTDGENVKNYFLKKLKGNFVIIYGNGSIEYVNHLGVSSNPNYVVVRKDKILPLLQYSPSNFTPTRTALKPNIMNTLPNKIDHLTPEAVSSSNYDYNPALSKDNDASDKGDYSSPVTQPQISQDKLSLLKPAGTNNKPQPHNNYDPLLEPLVSHSFSQKRNLEPHNNVYNSNKDNSHALKVQPHMSDTGTHTSTTPTVDDKMIEKFFDSLSTDSDNRSPIDRQLYSITDENPPQNNNDYPHSKTHAITPMSKLHMEKLPGIFRATNQTPDNLSIQKNLDSQYLEIGTSSTMVPGEYHEILQDYSTTQISPVAFSDSDSIDRIMRKSDSIEEAPENVKDCLTLNQEKEGTLDSMDDIKYLSIEDEVATTYGTTTRHPAATVVQNTDSSDDSSIQIADDTEIEKIYSKSDNPNNSNDNTAEINHSCINEEETSTDDNLELEPPTKDSESNIPIDLNESNYDNIDASGNFTGKENTSSDETLSITRQNSIKIVSVTENSGTMNHNHVKKEKTTSDRNSFDNDLTLDLSNALVVKNNTSDDNFWNHFLTGDSKVNLFIFPMPSQDLLLERLTEKTIYPNGTCVVEITETTWKHKDDPTPTTISIKKIYEDDKCRCY